MSLPPEKWYICQKKKTVDLETHEQERVRKQMQTIYEVLHKVEKIKPLVVEVKRPRKRGGTKRKLKENRRELQRTLKESLLVSNGKGSLTIKVPEEDSIDNLIEEVTEDTFMNEEQEEREEREEREECEECDVNEVEPEKTQDDIELEERIYRDVEWVLEEDESTNITEPQEETPQVETPQVELSFDEILQIALLQNEIIKNEMILNAMQQIAIPQPPIPEPAIPEPAIPPPVPDYSQYSIPQYLQYLQYTVPQYSQPTIPTYSQPTYSQPLYSHPTIPQYSQPTIPQAQYSQPKYTLPQKERTHTTTNGYTYWNLGASKFVPNKKRPYRMM